MSFIESVKSEIFKKPIKEKHCRKAFLAGIIRGIGSVFIDNNNELGIDLKVSSEEFAIYLSETFRSIYNYDVREVSVSEDKLNKKDKFVITITGEVAQDILTDLEILTEEEGELVVNLKFYGKLIERECCLRAFIRGLFVAVGSCTLPKNNTANTTGYHLEMVFSHYTPALETSEKLAQFNVITKITRRKENYILYIKRAEEIKDFLAFLPVPVAVLKLTDLMINRELINNSNRQKNCDLGNVTRQIEASQKQVLAIEKIIETIGLDSLKSSLSEVAKARVDNPEETLEELAKRLNLTKSCLNHRLRKLVTIAKEL